MTSENQEESGQKKTRSRWVLWLRPFVLVLILGIIFALRNQLHLATYLSRDQIGPTIAAIRSWVNGYGAWGPLMFVLACSALTIAYCPTAIVIFLLVTLFGHLEGILLSFAIIALGSSFVHVVAHRLGRPIIRMVSGRRWKKIESRMSERELLNVVLLRLVLFMNPALNWALGLSGVSYRNALLGTLIGTAPWVVLLTWMSKEIVGFVQSGNVMGMFKHPMLLIPIALALVLLRGNWLFDRLDKMRHPAPAAQPAAKPGPADNANTTN